MREKTTVALTGDLFRLMKQFPRPKLRQAAVDGLTRSEYELLVMLVVNHGKETAAFTVTELSNLLQITPAGVTHLINPLEEAGYVQRLHAPHDRRVVLVGLTEKGKRLAESLISEFEEQLIGLVKHLGEEDSRVLIRLLSRSIEF